MNLKCFIESNQSTCSQSEMCWFSVLHKCDQSMQHCSLLHENIKTKINHFKKKSAHKALYT